MGWGESGREVVIGQRWRRVDHIANAFLYKDILICVFAAVVRWSL